MDPSRAALIRCTLSKVQIALPRGALAAGRWGAPGLGGLLGVFTAGGRSGLEFAKYNHEDLPPKFECTSVIYSYTSFGANIAPGRTSCSLKPVVRGLMIDRHGLERSSRNGTGRWDAEPTVLAWRGVPQQYWLPAVQGSNG